jgi:hypothetical protein
MTSRILLLTLVVAGLAAVVDAVRPAGAGATQRFGGSS